MICRNCGFDMKDSQICPRCGAAFGASDVFAPSNVETPNKNNKKGKLKILFGIEIIILVGLMFFMLTFLDKMLDVEISNSMRKNLSVIEKYGYTIQDNTVYLTNQYNPEFIDEDVDYSFIGMKDGSYIEYYVMDEEFNANNQFNAFYENININARNNNYVMRYSLNLDDYRKYVVTTNDKMYVAILDDDNVLHMYGSTNKFKDEYNAILRDMGYVDEIKIEPLFVVSVILISLFFIIISIICVWRIFVKAGISGWFSLVPIVNIYYLYQISFGKGIYFLTLFIPVVNVVFGYIMLYKLAKAFGKSNLFAILNIFFSAVTLQILAFDDSKYNLNVKEG